MTTISAELRAEAKQYDRSLERLFAAFSSACQDLMDAKVDHCVALLDTVKADLISMADPDNTAAMSLLLSTVRDHMLHIKNVRGRPQ